MGEGVQESQRGVGFNRWNAHDRRGGSGSFLQYASLGELLGQDGEDEAIPKNGVATYASTGCKDIGVRRLQEGGIVYALAEHENEMGTRMHSGRGMVGQIGSIFTQASTAGDAFGKETRMDYGREGLSYSTLGRRPGVSSRIHSKSYSETGGIGKIAYRLDGGETDDFDAMSVV